MTAPPVPTRVPSALGVPLVGRRVALERLDGSHLPDLHRAATAPEARDEWPLLGRDATVAELADLLWSAGPIQFAIVRRDTGAAVGLVHALEEDLRSGTVSVGLFVEPELWRAGWPLEAVVLFLEYLFAGCGHRKAYFTMRTSTLDRLGGALASWLETECVYVRHVRMLGGGYEDLHVLSLHRDRWDSDLARRITGNPITGGPTTATA